MSCGGKASKPCWNEMEELKYLICAIDCCRCPCPCPPPVCSVMLPPRIQEMNYMIPPQRLVCCPPAPCSTPCVPGPCCPCPLPPPPPPRCPPCPPCKPCVPCTLVPQCPTEYC